MWVIYPSDTWATSAGVAARARTIQEARRPFITNVGTVVCAPISVSVASNGPDQTPRPVCVKPLCAPPKNTFIWSDDFDTVITKLKNVMGEPVVTDTVLFVPP